MTGGADPSLRRAEGDPMKADQTTSPVHVPQLANVADREWAMDLYGMFARGGDDEQLYYLQVDGEPWSKSRPRFSRRGRTYQPQDDREAEERLRTRLRAGGARTFPGNVMLVCRFYRSNFQRIDTDNLLKHVCDSANKVLWADDSQVTLVIGEVHLDPDHPRTVILAGNHASTLLRGDDQRRNCAHCDELFMPTAGARRDAQRYCSQACSFAARTTILEPITCPQCEREFRPTNKRQRLCSRECVRLKRTAVAKRKAGPPSACSECGTPLSHRRGGRCRACWRANPRMYTEPATSCADCQTDDCCGDCTCCTAAGWEAS